MGGEKKRKKERKKGGVKPSLKIVIKEDKLLGHTHTHTQIVYSYLYLSSYILPALAHRRSQVYVSNLEDAIRDLSY